MNSATGTFPKAATNNISIKRTVKVTTYICSTMLVTTYTDKNTDKNRTCAVKQTSHISTHYFSSLQKHLLLLFIKQLRIPKYTKKYAHTSFFENVTVFVNLSKWCLKYFCRS